MKSTKNLILISVGLMTFFIFCFEAVFSVYNQQSESLLLNETLLVNVAVKEAKNLDHQISEVSQNARVLALLIGNNESMDPIVYDKFIRDTIMKETIAFGMGYWFEPYAFDDNMIYYGPYIYKDSNNTIVKTMEYSTKEYDYLSQDWYQNSIISDKTVAYSSPFYDEYLDTVFMSAAVKIVDKDIQIGVVSIDITLREINDYLGEISETNNATTFIVTEEGYFWGDGEGQNLDLDENILTSSNNELKELGPILLKSDQAGSITLDENIYVWSNIGDTGLRLAMGYPKVNIMYPIYQRIILNLAYFITAMLVFMILLNIILVHRIQRPLVTLINHNLGNDEEEEGLNSKEFQDELHNFDGMIRLIQQLLTERQRYIHTLNENNSELLNKNEEIEALYHQTEAMNKTLHQLLDDVQKGYIVTVRSLSNAIEAKDKYTKGHCENVTKYSIETAKILGLSEEDLAVLEYAALLHDVGKIGVPSSILNKPSKLSDEEFDIIKTHPAIGYEMLKDIDFLKRSALIVFQHHERIDGKGYPRGLTKDELDILTKIITVTDAYDAMTSERPYRLNPLSPEKAMSILIEGSGTQFDPDVIEAFKIVLAS